MQSNSRRKNSLRLSGYDYSQRGAYFVTMCTKDRQLLFGRVENGMMQLTEAGEIVSECWKEIPGHFPNAKLDEFIVMPDHLHGIILVTGRIELTIGLVLGGAIQESPRNDPDDPVWRRRMLLPKIIGRFKQNSAKKINILRSTPGLPVWQRGYYDHIIRDVDSFSHIKQYILSNPHHWTSP